MSDLRPSRGPTAGQLILLIGGAQVLIIYLLLAVDSPLRALANRATETWSGRIILAGIGWGLITVTMITVLTIAERRAKRPPGGHR